MNIPAYILQRLRRTLPICGPFGNDSDLRAVFVDDRISCWQNLLPDASSIESRVNVTIDYLSDQASTVGENGLVLLLSVLSDLKKPADSCHENLSALAEELKRLATDQQIPEGGGPETPAGNLRTNSGTEAQVIPPAVPRPVNLGFEGLAPYGRPAGWFNSLGFVGGVSTAYEYKVVPRNDRPDRHCVRMSYPQAKPEDFGSLMQRCLVNSYLAGRAVLLQAQVMTDDVFPWAGVWLRADDGNGQELFFDNMSNRPIRGSTGWTQYAIDCVLPANTVWLNYGVVLVGHGTLWADDFQLWVWSTHAGRWMAV